MGRPEKGYSPLFLRGYKVIIFDANDVKELMIRFTPEQLRHEISTARMKLRGECDWRWQVYYEDYIKVCQLAIAIQWQPKPKDPQFRESIEDIKSRYDLVEYIGQYVKLRKSGNKYQCLCPFHADKKTESFFVYPDNTYHCFGCRAHGTIIDFVMQYHDLDIKQAIERLAN